MTCTASSSRTPTSSAQQSACSRWPGPPAAPSAPNGGCAAPPARPGGCAPSSRPRPPTISDSLPAPAGNLNPSDHQEVTMNRTRAFRPIHRLACALAGLAAALLAAAAAAPAAFALPVPPGGGGDGTPPPVQTVVVGGMPGWQIALIAVAAAVVAAALAVFLNRVRVGRRHQAATSA